MERRILALDQSSHTSGYAIFINGTLKDFGHFTFNDDDIGIRLLKIKKSVLNLIENYQITELVIEDIQLQSNIANNVSTFKVLAEVFGVLYELATELNLKFTAILAISWKNGLKIKARQRLQQKQETQQLVYTLYNIKATQDESDAICLGAYYLIMDTIDNNVEYDWSD